MVTNHLRRHRYTIAISVPIAVLVASSLTLIRSADEMCVVPDDNRYVEVGEHVTLEVLARADEPINVIGAEISLPPDLLSIERLSTDNSIIDLWTEPPSIVDASTVRFAGGIVSDGGFVGQGLVTNIHVVPLAPGKATVSFNNVHMLAHDGSGSEVPCGNNPVVLSIRPASHPSPDVNGDHQVDFFDFGLVSSRLFMSYARAYDLNLDGRITLADIGIIISSMVDESRLGSFAGLFHTRA